MVSYVEASLKIFTDLYQNLQTRAFAALKTQTGIAKLNTTGHMRKYF